MNNEGKKFDATSKVERTAHLEPLFENEDSNRSTKDAYPGSLGTSSAPMREDPPPDPIPDDPPFCCCCCCCCWASAVTMDWAREADVGLVASIIIEKLGASVFAVSLPGNISLSGEFALHARLDRPFFTLYWNRNSCWKERIIQYLYLIDYCFLGGRTIFLLFPLDLEKRLSESICF